MYILIKSSFRRKAVKNPLGHTSVSERRETAPLRILRGVIKKYSEKKEWGVIGVRESESDSESDDETMVRFLRSERDRVGLQPGDPVIFRAIPDPHMQGWLLAETIWKAPQDTSSNSNEVFGGFRVCFLLGGAVGVFAKFHAKHRRQAGPQRSRTLLQSARCPRLRQKSPDGI